VDVVHVHLLHLHPTLAACRAARSTSTPYVVAPCGSLDRAWRNRSRAIKAATDRVWQREALNRAAALHYKTEQEKTEAGDFGLAPRAWVVPNGIGLLDDRHQRRSHEPARDSARTVLFLGRITYKKRVDLLLEAFGDVHRALPAARLVVAGPDDEALLPKLEQASRRLGLDHYVSFPGHVQGAEKQALLEHADVFVLPSTSENFGIGVVEALAAGLPAVATPGVAIAREAAGERAALLAEDSAAGVADALLAVLRDREVREDLARRGRRFAKRYTWRAVVPRLTEMYESAMGKAAP
jgi:glycosyltransferase involved in cell wall biosynthesis